MDDSTLYERRARICQVLADAKRLRLIDALRDDAEKSVGELAESSARPTRMSPST